MISLQPACTMHRKDQLDAMVQDLSLLGSFYRIVSKPGVRLQDRVQALVWNW